MTDEKPLHVRVAEALGLEPQFRYTDNEEYSTGWCACGQSREFGHSFEFEAEQAWLAKHQPHLTLAWECPRYDTSWEATGPLIEKYGLAVLPVRGDNDTVRLWSADHLPSGVAADGPSPLQAVCYLILALKKAGKL